MFGVSILKEARTSSNVQTTTDFVWVVRLAKISKRLIVGQWKHETVSSGATPAVDNEADKVHSLVDALQSEGLGRV